MDLFSDSNPPPQKRTATKQSQPNVSHSGRSQMLHQLDHKEQECNTTQNQDGMTLEIPAGNTEECHSLYPDFSTSAACHSLRNTYKDGISHHVHDSFANRKDKDQWGERNVLGLPSRPGYLLSLSPRPSPKQGLSLYSLIYTTCWRVPTRIATPTLPYRAQVAIDPTGWYKVAG